MKTRSETLDTWPFTRLVKVSAMASAPSFSLPSSHNVQWGISFKKALFVLPPMECWLLFLPCRAELLTERLDRAFEVSIQARPPTYLTAPVLLHINVRPFYSPPPPPYYQELIGRLSPKSVRLISPSPPLADEDLPPLSVR